MSEEKRRFPGIRRVGRKDRKRQIQTGGLVFPPESLPPLPDEPPPNEVESAPENHQEQAVHDPIPFDNMADALADALKGVEELPPPLPPAPPVPVQKPLVKAQPERFPPVRPKSPPPRPVPTRRRGLAAQDLIAILFFLATIAAVAYFIFIWRNPFSPLNPLAPPTPFVIITATPDYGSSQGTSLDQTAPQSTAVSTPLVAGTPFAFDTPTFIPLETAALSAYPFALSESGVVYIPNNNGRGCDWSSIAGTVTGMNGEALNSYGIEIVGGSLDEKVFSGTAQTFGPGGFELFLSGVPQKGEYTAQLFSPAGAPLSEPYTVTTSDQCEQNVALVNFVQQRAF